MNSRLKGKIISIALFLTLFTPLNLFAQSEYPFGLEFNSREVVQEKRTTLDITATHTIKLKDAFSISFQVCFRNSDFMGTVFEVLDKNFHSELLFVDYPKADTALLKLNFNNRTTPISFSLPKSALSNNRWFNITVKFDLLSKSIQMELDGKKYRASGMNLKPEINALINFGLRRKYSCDTPPMSIKDLRINDTEDKLVHQWLFNEIDGDIAHDNIGDIDAKVYNPNWLLPKHYHWNLVAKIGAFSKADIPGINYDSRNQRIVIVFKNTVYFFNTINKSIFKKVSTIPQKEFSTIYSNKNDKLYSQHSGQGKISVFDEPNSNWKRVDTTGEHDKYYYGHNLFEDSFTGKLLMMNGYGWYKMNNILQEYNFQSESWKKIQLNGDYILPRRRASISSVDSTGSYYLFGGFGNHSGKQEDGYYYLQDFYKINYQQKTVKKIWDMKHLELDLYPTSTMILDSNEKCFYVGAINLRTNSSFTKLYKFYLDETKYEVVGDSIPAMNFYDGHLYSPLIFDEKQQQFYLQATIPAGKDSFYLLLYSLNNIPIDANLLTGIKYKEKRNLFASSYFYMGIAVLGLIGLFLFGYYKKKFFWMNTSKKNNSEIEISNEILLNAKNIFPPNSVYFFGDFKMFDKNGAEVTNEFTPKIKQLFFLLFLNTFNSHRNGISIDEISAILWSEHSNDQVKNNRNVTFSKLRGILNKLDGIEIKNEKGFCSLELTNGIYSDFLEFQSSLISNNLTLEKLEQLKSILERGEFLHGYSFEWLDSLKASFVDNSIKTLVNLYQNENYDIKLNSIIGDLILFLDSVNEDGVSIKIKSLIELQNHSQAKKVYNNFQKEYYRLFAEEYSKSFSEISN